MNLKKHSTIILILILHIQVSGQAEKVSMSRKYNDQTKSYNLIADNPFPGNTALEVTFTRASNMVCNDGNSFFAKTLREGKNTVTKISRLQSTQNVEFAYSFRYIEGCANTNPDFDYPYLIPLKQGNKTSIRQLTNVQKKYEEYSAPKDWYSITLKAEDRDTVFAARRGLVTKVVYDRNDQNLEGISYTSSRNWMSIQHKDCTTAKYQLFADDEIWVEPGDLVEVGQPLGVISSENYSSGSHLRFSVFYYNPHPKLKAGKDVGKRYLHAYVPIKFYTKEGIIKLQDRKEYEVVLDPEMITKDMSKKELKKWIKNQ